MGIKLKSKIIIIILSILVTNCSSKKGVTYESKKAFVQSFKVSVAYGCINTATNGNFQKFSIDNNDLGLAPEISVLYHSETFEAQKLGKKLSREIRSINYADYEGRKPIFSDCINFAFSKKVDSIAKKKYKKLKRAKLEYKYD